MRRRVRGRRSCSRSPTRRTPASPASQSLHGRRDSAARAPTTRPYSTSCSRASGTTIPGRPTAARSLRPRPWRLPPPQLLSQCGVARARSIRSPYPSSRSSVSRSHRRVRFRCPSCNSRPRVGPSPRSPSPSPAGAVRRSRRQPPLPSTTHGWSHRPRPSIPCSSLLGHRFPAWPRPGSSLSSSPLWPEAAPSVPHPSPSSTPTSRPPSSSRGWCPTSPPSPCRCFRATNPTWSSTSMPRRRRPAD